MLETLLQVFISYNILIFTVLSISAISTNGDIEGGGIYFMSSRVLGPEFGGSIGLLFLVANVVSSAFNVAGCVEALMSNFGPAGTIATFLPDGQGTSLIYASIINAINLLICLFGATMFAKATLIIFGVVVSVAVSAVFSLIFAPGHSVKVPDDNNSFNGTLRFTGLSLETLKGNLYPSYAIDYTAHTEPRMTTFATVFGVFFTGVTGVLAGANISGDLKNPARSIPLGTLSGILCTAITYCVIFVLSAASCSRELLQNNYLYMQSLNEWHAWPIIVEIGVLSATVSAALTNLIGASRLLNAIARDRLFGRLLDPIFKINRGGNPIGSVLATWLIIQLMLFIGSLNQIAQISSILFLFTYFSLNLACMMCILTSAPNFRPSFKYFNLATTIVGLIGASGMTFVVDPLYSSLVIIVWLSLMIGIHVRSPNVHGGYITQALIFHQVRKYLLMLDHRKEHVKFWRPRILLMIENPRSCLPLIDFVNDLKKSGLFVIGHVQLGSLDEFEVDPMLDQYPVWLKWLDQFTVKAFIEITLAPSVREGLHQIARIAGLGAMKLNTVVFGFYDDSTPVDFLQNDERYQTLEQTIWSDGREDLFKIRKSGRLTRSEYVGMVSDSMRKLQKIVCLARNFHTIDTDRLGKKDFGKFFIDVWPINFFQRNSSPDNCANLIMQFACILNMVPKWKASTTIRLMVCADHENQHRYFNQWQKRLAELRIDAELNIIAHESLNIVGTNQGALSDTIWESVNIDYVKSINRMIVAQSELTAVSFLYLPMAPRSQVFYDMYLNCLENLTANMPPTLLVHGNDQVVSTSL